MTLLCTPVSKSKIALYIGDCLVDVACPITKPTVTAVIATWNKQHCHLTLQALISKYKFSKLISIHFLTGLVERIGSKGIIYP